MGAGPFAGTVPDICETPAVPGVCETPNNQLGWLITVTVKGCAPPPPFVISNCVDAMKFARARTVIWGFWGVRFKLTGCPAGIISVTGMLCWTDVVIVMLPLYVPAASEPGVAVTVSNEGAPPDAGETVRNELLGPAAAVNASGVWFEGISEITCESALPLCPLAVNVRLAGRFIRLPGCGIVSVTF